MSGYLRHHGLQHARLPCPSLSIRVCSNSYPLNWWCHPTISSSVTSFSSCPQSFPASGCFLISWLCIRWPKYWNFSLSISPSKEYSGLISFRMDWLDLLAVQGTLKSLLQHHSSTLMIHKFWEILSQSLFGISPLVFFSGCKIISIFLSLAFWSSN